jgi:hypothetical protein
MDTEQLKIEVAQHLDAAITENGGIERVRKIYGLMSGVIDFIAGWTCARVLADRRTKALAIKDRWPEAPTLSHEEIRRIYDLVRLALDTGSSTS